MSSNDQQSLSLDTKTCTKCGATWIGGQHYWYTGKKGGVTWEQRREFLSKLEDESSDG